MIGHHTITRPLYGWT